MKKYYLIAAVVLAISANFFIAKAANYTLGVNAASTGATWNNFMNKGVALDHMYTVIGSAYGRNAQAALAKAHSEAGFTYVRGHGILDDDVGVYVGAGNYSWTNFDAIYDAIIAAGMKPIVELGFMPGALASARTCITSVWYNNVCGYSCGPSNWTNWENLIKAIIAHVETRYGAAEVRNNWFFELWNEPNWMYACGGNDAGYQTLYNHTAVAVAAQDPLVRLGGPAENGGSSQGFVATMIQYCRTNSLKLDFITWHRYSNDGTGNNYAADVITFNTTMHTVCSNNSFTGLQLCTETGPSYTQGLAVHDNEQSASWVARVAHGIFANGNPPYCMGWWALSDIYEETNNTGSSANFCGCYGLLTRGNDIEKPAFQTYRMLNKLSIGPTLTVSGASGNVNGIGTISTGRDTISILVYSHVEGTGGNSSTTDNITLNITGIPSSGSITTATMTHYVVDVNHSNSYRTWVSAGSPTTPTAAVIAAGATLGTYDTPGTVTLGGTVGAATYTKVFTQNYYSVGLIQLTNFRSTAVSEPLKKVDFAATRINARVAGKSIIIALPSAARYTVWLYSANGQMVLNKQIAGRGTNVLSLANVPAGVYTLECTGCSQSLVKKVIVGR